MSSLSSTKRPGIRSQGSIIMPPPLILIVEDEVHVADFLDLTLRALGYEVSRVVGSGEEAVDVALDIGPDLILMDILLEGEIDGIEAANRIRTHLDVPVVFVTAYRDENLFARAKLTGPFGVLLKPFQKDQLRMAVEIALYKHQVEMQARADLERLVEERTTELVKTNERLMKEIVDRERAEEALRQSEVTHRNLVERANDGIIVVQEGVIQYANPRLTQMIGYPAEEVVGRPFQDFVHPDMSTVGADGYGSAQTEQIGEGVFQAALLHRDGDRVEVEINKSRVDREGKPAHLVIVRDVTYRKTIERELKESEMKHRSVVENAGEGIVVIQDGYAQYLNPKATEVLGFTEKELMERPSIEFVHPDDRAAARLRYEARLAGEDVPQTVVIRVINAQGEVIWVDLNSVLIHWFGRPAVLVIGTDISDRKRKDDEIRQQKEFLANVLESLTHPFYVIDPDTYRVVMANSAGGVDLLSNPTSCYELAHGLTEPCNTSAYPCPVDMVKRTGKPFAIEHEHRDEDGGIRKVEVHAYPLLDKNGQVSRVIEYMLDITDRRKAEEALRESEGRLRAVFDMAQDCIYIKDRSMKYTHVNPALAKLLGLDAAELIGKTDAELFGKATGEHLEALDRRVLDGESVEHLHARPVHGVGFTFLESKVPIRNSAGEVVGLGGIARNVTDRAYLKPPTRASRDSHRSKAYSDAYATAMRAARSDGIILLLGETGSGKDYLARQIHDNSRRSDGPFFTVNCSAVGETLAESELFGHEAGSFTGASRRKRGLLELAEGGTILLNEIGELSPSLQAKLLTFLDTRSFHRVGGVKKVFVNARLLAATNRNLEEDVATGRFRSDLFYRLNVLAIRVPPLRERKDDVPLLCDKILKEISERMGFRHVPKLDDRALTAMAGYGWPGNVRELRNLLERAVIIAGEGRPLNIPGLLEIGAGNDRTGREQWSTTVTFPEGENLDDTVARVKRDLILEALARTGGKKHPAARLLGISRHSLLRLMKKLGL